MRRSYRFRAVDATAGTLHRGVVEAHSRAAAAETLRRRGWYVVRLQRDFLSVGWRPTLAREELALLAKQLATLLEAGVDLIAALNLLAESRGGRIEMVLRAAALDIADGSSLAAALEHSRSFPPLFCQLVRAGEAGGVLAENLRYASLYYREEERRRRGWRDTLTYPVLVLTLAFAVFLFSIFWLLPMFAELFASLGTKPSSTTAVLLSFSAAARNYGDGVLLPALLLMAGIWAALRTDAGALRLAIWGDRIPFYRYRIYARIAAIQSLLLRGGLAYDEALRLTGSVTDSPLYRRRFERMRQAVLTGSSPAAAAVGSGLNEKVYLYMLRVGTESGRLTELLADAAIFYEEEAKRLAERYRTWLGPTVLLMTGVWVGLLLYSILLPLLDAVTTPLNG